MSTHLTQKSKVLVVGAGSYLGYNFLKHIAKGITAMGLYISENDRPGEADWRCEVVDRMEHRDFKKRLMSIVEAFSADWIVLIPEPDGGARGKVFVSLLEVCAHVSTAGLLFLSHDGVDRAAARDGRTQLAELFKFEGMILGCGWSTCTIILRVAMLQEQLFFLLPQLLKGELSYDASRLNPVATMDVVHCMRTLVQHLPTKQHHRQIFTLAGQQDLEVRPFEVLARKLSKQESGQQDECPFVDHHESVYRNVVLDLLHRLRRRGPAAPLWPSLAERALLQEYFWYCMWNGQNGMVNSDMNILCSQTPGSVVPVLRSMEEVIQRV